MFPLRRKRSGGIPVSAAVHRLVARGNRARDCRDWDEAALAYDQALRAAPELAHIWVQYGHASKERGDVVAARVAYERAAGLRPSDPDPLLHLGHLAKLLGDKRTAERHYLACFRVDPGHADAAMELHRAIAAARGQARDELIEVMRTSLELDTEFTGAGTRLLTQGTRDTLVFDVSDLLLFYAHARLPTGIQRVQIQTITNAIGAGGDIRLCCFIDGRDDWLEIPLPAFQELVALSLQSGDRTEPGWITALHHLHFRLAITSTFEFPRGCTLVNLGSSWQLPNYFLFIRAAKSEFDIRYVPFVHDLIPIVAPEHFTRGAKMDVVPWVIGILTHADHYLANSEATKRDLLQTADLLGRAIDPGDVTVIRLDADFRPPADPLQVVMPGDTTAALARMHLGTDPFVLLVSTVESRKGHAVAFDAWRQLIDRHGADRVPRLVCVGRKGWLAEHLYDRLKTDAALASRVTMLSGVVDQDLALLYRECLFTVYPSLYEGWGLPITEALCYGKPVIAANTSSLPEAGGTLATYVPPNDAAALATEVERLAFDKAARGAISARIAAEFRPRQWAEIAAQLRSSVANLSLRNGGVVRKVDAPVAVLGAYHSLARSTATIIWPGARATEAFRTGKRWFSPGPDRCLARPQGGELTIAVPQGAGALRLGLCLFGASRHDVAWRVSVRNGPSAHGMLARDTRKWVLLTLQPALSAAGAGPLRLRLRGEAADPVPGPDEDEASVGLSGFFIYAENDTAAGTRLLEAIAMGNLDDVDANRPPFHLAISDEDWTA